MAKKTVTPSIETLEPRIYEIGYLLSPAVRDEDLETRVNEIKETLTKLGATFIADGAPEFIDLAYEMSRVIDNKRVRFNQGYFGWVKFQIEPKALVEVKEVLDRDITIIRYLLISTVAENTVISKKPLGKLRQGARKDELANQGDIENDIPVEKIDEELDNEIKELVKEI